MFRGGKKGRWGSNHLQGDYIAGGTFGCVVGEGSSSPCPIDMGGGEGSKC